MALDDRRFLKPGRYPKTLEQWRTFVFSEHLSFEEKALQIYRYQRENQPVYQSFCRAFDPAPVDQIPLIKIPLIPIQVFRHSALRPVAGKPVRQIFRSSGTTGAESRSAHPIVDPELYYESCYRCFSLFYDPPEWILLAWLPGYADNPESSLIAMIDHFVRQDHSGRSRFLPFDQPAGESIGSICRQTGESDRRIMLFGAAFGLLDIIESGPLKLPDGSLVVETGGMKTHRREIGKEELRLRLARGFGLPETSIHSEYGMAEMCSQAWDTGDGWLETPSWLRITIRSPEDPEKVLPAGQPGLIGIMDLANVHSLSFFLTQDRGVARADGSFRVLGRWDHAEPRGCNLLLEKDIWHK